jgi:hypothetical protein
MINSMNLPLAFIFLLLISVRQNWRNCFFPKERRFFLYSPLKKEKPFFFFIILIV